MTGMEACKEEEIMDSVLKECEQFTVKLTPQSHFARSLCLMTYLCKKEESDLELSMTEIQIVYGPLSSFIDMDDHVDLELACLSQMSITLFCSKHPNSPSPNELFLEALWF